MKDFWNARYQAEAYAYGVCPSVFFSEEIRKWNPGKALFPAEGEGRNAVYAATLGWEVSAFDLSESGRDKALQLAAQASVQIDYSVTPLEEFDATKESYDALVLVYAHFPASSRKEFHKKLAGYLKPGGLLLVEGFSKQHVHYQAVNDKAGGPKDPSMLFSKEELLQDFEGFDCQLLQEDVVQLNEGLYHVGESAVVRLVATKKVSS
jgi:SAM-dependent methyltransferase